jgi:hypothetical protein
MVLPLLTPYTTSTSSPAYFVWCSHLQLPLGCLKSLSLIYLKFLNKTAAFAVGIADRTTEITNMYLLKESQQYYPCPNMGRGVTCKIDRYSVEFIEMVLTEISLDCVNWIQVAQDSADEHLYSSSVEHLRGPTQKKRDYACKSFCFTNSGNQLRSPSK